MALRELLLSLGVGVDANGVKNADAALGKLKKAAIVTAAAFAAIKAVKGIGSLVDGVRGLGDEIDKTSQQLGLGVEELQEWRFAAGLAGVGGEEMSNSLGRLQKNAFEASKGNKTLAEDFKRLGVNVKDADGNLKNADTLLTEMSDGFQGLDNDSEKVALSLNLMGRTGRKLLPLFKDGSVGIKKMREEAQSLGGVMDQDLINATVKLTDDQFRAQQAWQGVKNDIAGAVIPIFIKWSNAMVSVAKAVRGPLKGAIQVIRTIVEAFTGTMEVLNETFSGLGTAFSALIPILGALGIAMTIFGRKAVVAALRTAAGWALAALPFLLIAALIGLVFLALEDVIVFMKGGDSLIGRFIMGFRKWIKQMGGVGAAIGRIFEILAKRVFGLSDDMSRKVGAVFAAVAAVIEFIFVTIPTVVGESLAAAYLWVVQFAKDFEDAMTAAVDAVIERYEALVDAVADFIEAAAKATGLDSLVDKGAKRDYKQEAIDDRKRKKESAARLSQRIKIFKQLEKEGFGTFTGPQAGQANVARNVGLTGIKDQAAAQARLNQLTQDINAPITVNVDASGQSSPAAIGESVATKVNKVQNTRQSMQGFVTGPPRKVVNSGF